MSRLREWAYALQRATWDRALQWERERGSVLRRLDRLEDTRQRMTARVFPDPCPNFDVMVGSPLVTLRSGEERRAFISPLRTIRLVGLAFGVTGAPVHTVTASAFYVGSVTQFISQSCSPMPLSVAAHAAHVTIEPGLGANVLLQYNGPGSCDVSVAALGLTRHKPPVLDRVK